MIGWIDILLVLGGLLALGVPTFLIYKTHSNKKKYPFKINLVTRRNNGWVTNTNLRGGVVKDQKGVSIFRIPNGFKKFYEKRELPSSNVILADGTIYMAKVGETLMYLNPKVEMDIEQGDDGIETIRMLDKEGGKTVSFKPTTPQTKYDAIKDINDAFRMVESGGFDWKPIIAYGGLVLLFIGVIVVTYLIWDKIDLDAIARLTETNQQITQTNLEIVEKLRGLSC